MKRRDQIISLTNKAEKPTAAANSLKSAQDLQNTNQQ